MSQHRMRQQSKADRVALGKRRTETYNAETTPPMLKYHRAGRLHCGLAPGNVHGQNAAHYHLLTPATPRGGYETTQLCGMPGEAPLLYRHKRAQRGAGRRTSGIRKNRPARGDKDYSGRISRGGDLQARKSQCKYLLNINVHDKWLKMAVVSKALFWACSMEESTNSSYSMELRKFEHFGLFTLVFASSYLRRVITAQVLGPPTFLKLFLVCNIIALKYQEDYNTMNSRYCEDWGIQLESINAIEAEVLVRLNYDLAVKYSEIVSVLDERIYCLKRLRLR